MMAVDGVDGGREAAAAAAFHCLIESVLSMTLKCRPAGRRDELIRRRRMMLRLLLLLLLLLLTTNLSTLLSRDGASSAMGDIDGKAQAPSVRFVMDLLWICSSSNINPQRIEQLEFEPKT